jgi:hypothetical protein
MLTYIGQITPDAGKVSLAAAPSRLLPLDHGVLTCASLQAQRGPDRDPIFLYIDTLISSPQLFRSEH